MLEVEPSELFEKLAKRLTARLAPVAWHSGQHVSLSAWEMLRKRSKWVSHFRQTYS